MGEPNTKINIQQKQKSNRHTLTYIKFGPCLYNQRLIRFIQK